MEDNAEKINQTEENKAPDWTAIRRDFPALDAEIYDKPLAYLDNAATTHKPQTVINAIVRHYISANSNIHRGAYFLSRLATDKYENAREVVANFIGVEKREIVFTRGTTESINLVAAAYGRKNIAAGDAVAITEMEHHSNILPWQQLCEERGATLRVIPVSDSGELLLDNLDSLLANRVKLLALTHVSNTLGTINPAREIIEAAHKQGIPVLLDGAQAAPHLPVNARELDCDFYAFSGHKIFAPSGIGVLYAKKSILNAMPPYQTGGGMIRRVSFEGSTFAEAPEKFEAGTPNIEGAIGLAEAVKYVQSIGLDNIAKRERELLNYARLRLSAVPNLKIYGISEDKASVISFTLGDIHPHDISSFLDRAGIAVRAGHHCNQPLWRRYGIPATTRASLAFYNTEAEIDLLANELQAVERFFS